MGLGTAAYTAATAYATAAQGTDSRDPKTHASTHGDGAADEVSIDASQITGGTLADARTSALARRDAYAWALTPHGYSVVVGFWPLAVHTAATPARLHLGCTTAPAGSAIIVDLKQATSPAGSQTSILSSTLSLATSATEATTTSFASGAALALEDAIVAHVTQADSSAASRGCVLTLEVTSTP